MVILPASRHFCRRSFFGAQAIRPAGPRQSWVAAIGGGVRWGLSSYPADGTGGGSSGAWGILARRQNHRLRGNETIRRARGDWRGLGGARGGGPPAPPFPTR